MMRCATCERERECVCVRECVRVRAREKRRERALVVYKNGNKWASKPANAIAHGYQSELEAYELLKYTRTEALN